MALTSSRASANEPFSRSSTSNIKGHFRTLGHRGVLLLDELPEFPRPVLEALRQPLEDGVVSVARVGGRALFPARFRLVATIKL